MLYREPTGLCQTELFVGSYAASNKLKKLLDEASRVSGRTMKPVTTVRSGPSDLPPLK